MLSKRRTGTPRYNRRIRCVWYFLIVVLFACPNTILNATGQNIDGEHTKLASIAIFTFKAVNRSDSSQAWTEAMARSITASIKKVKDIRVLVKGNDLARQLNISDTGEIDEKEAVTFGRFAHLQWVVLVDGGYENGTWTTSERFIKPATSTVLIEIVTASTNWFHLQQEATLTTLKTIQVEPSPPEINDMQRVWDCRPRTMFQFARAFMLVSESSEHLEAAGILKDITNSDPTFSEAYALFAAIQARNGKREESESLAATGLRFGGDNSYVHKVYGYLLLSDNRILEAENEFNISIRIYPDDPDLFDYLGNIYVLRDELPEAVKSFKRGILLFPYGEFAGNIRAKLDFWEPRSQPYYFSQKPPNAPARIGGYFQKNAQSCLTNNFVNPFDCSIPMTKWAERLTFGSTNQLEKAKLIFNALIQHVQIDKLDFQPRTASEVFSAWEAADASFHCQEYAFLYVALSRAVGLDSYFVEVEETVDGQKGLHSCAAVFLGEKMILIDPSYMWFGVRHLKFNILNDIQASASYLCSLQSTEDCKRAAQLAPELNIVQLNLFKSQTLAGRWDMALQTMTNMMIYNSNSWMIIICQADVASHEGNIEQAINLLNQASMLSPNTGAIYVQLGDLYMKDKDADNARRSYKKALMFMLSKDDREHVNNMFVKGAGLE